MYAVFAAPLPVCDVLGAKNDDWTGQQELLGAADVPVFSWTALTQTTRYYEMLTPYKIQMLAGIYYAVKYNNLMYLIFHFIFI